MNPSPAPTNSDANLLMRRRVAVGTFVLICTGSATLIMADLLWGMPMQGWNGVVLSLFALLFALISFGCGQAFFGFWVRRTNRRTLRIENTLPPEDEPLAPLAATAIVLPIHNEDVKRVYAGLSQIYRSLEHTGQLKHFDFFILSDSTDVNRWIDEETGWVQLSRELNARGRIFYRKRRITANRKAGNIADFCRRWGKRYRYMLVLDADSVMAGATIVRMVRLMERNPRVGLLQTVPMLVRGESLFARALQFAMSAYGRIHSAGLDFWQHAGGNYYGHNAVIRTAAFIEHCALPTLPGREPFGGKILSHDFVEAALLRRAGWEVWLAPDLGGSYEEGPPTLIDAAKRDRRWCQGNLQHLWLLFARGLHPVSRLHLLLGILAYAASPVWLVFLALGTLLMVGFERTGLTWVPTPGFATALGVPSSVESGVLLAFTAIILFGPKLLAGLDTMLSPGGAAGFGGTRKLWESILLETLLSVILAPILMLFHTKFVVMTVLGRGVHWVSQNRDDAEGTTWREAAAAHTGHTLLGLVWGAVVVTFTPHLLPWFSPVLLGMVISIPFSVWTSRPRWGAFARRHGWFMIPEEVFPPPELKGLTTALQQTETPPKLSLLVPHKTEHGLVRVVLDPFINAVHICLLRERPGQGEDFRTPFKVSREKLLAEGPDSLTQQEQLSLLSDPESLEWLHQQVWSRSPEALSHLWQQALQFPTVVSTG